MFITDDSPLHLLVNGLDRSNVGNAETQGQ